MSIFREYLDGPTTDEYDDVRAQRDRAEDTVAVMGQLLGAERARANDEARRADRAEMRLANLVLALAGLLILSAVILWFAALALGG